MANNISRFVNNMNMYHLLYNPQATLQLSHALLSLKKFRTSYKRSITTATLNHLNKNPCT